MYILDIVHQAVGWAGLGAVDPALAAEVVLRLALVFEASAALAGKPTRTRAAQPQQQPELDLVSMVTNARGE